MLTMHGRAYHRIFDLQERYSDTMISNNSRFYVYDSEFTSRLETLRFNDATAQTLRQHVHENIPWAARY